MAKHCKPCDKFRNTPCTAVCHAFSSKADDQLEQARNRVSRQRLRLMSAINAAPPRGQ